MNKKLHKILAIAALSLGLAAGLTACDSKTEEPDAGGNSPANVFSVDDQYLNHTINKAKKTIEIPVNVPASTSKWFANSEATWIFVTKENAINGVGKVVLTVDENNTGQTRDGVVTISSTSKNITINVKQYSESGLVVAGDFPVKPVSASASSEQPGGQIALSYDDDVKTLYHSSWTSTTFPVELKYNFNGREAIDYVEYVPRQGGGNGCFKEFEVYVSEDASKANFEKIGEFNFRGSSSANKVVFPQSKQATCVKFVVKSGVGDFASCAEMRFFRYNTESSLDRQLLEVFTDVTCSELKSGVTAEQIEALDPAFQIVAEALKNNTYDELEKSFRIHEYEAYSDPVEWSEKLMTKIYSNWDNPMGIAVKKGEKVLILVGETHGNSLSVQILGEDSSGNEYRPQHQGTFHSLRPGVNQIEADQEGQLFLIYTAVPSAATSKPIKVHIPLGQGSFAGYWRLSEHKTDEKFAEIIARGTHKYFCVVGNRMLLYFNRLKYPRKIVDPINQWDNIITWQQDFMGIEDVRPALWNNHIAGISSTYSSDYMWASNYTMCFNESAIEKIMGLDRLNANADNAWGPAHEMGHVNQIAINWASTTESSNNLFSNYVLYRFGRYNSRGRGLQYRFTAVYEKNQSWASMSNSAGTDGPAIPVINGEPFDEETGIHMRLNWQLWNYYHRVRKDEKFFGRVFKIMRDLGMNETENCGKKQIEYAVACSQAAGEDLTDFFEAWGFFKAHNSRVSQYGTYDYNVTQPMISDAKKRMSQYPKPKHALEYIEDRNVKMGEKPGDYAFDMVGDLGYYETYEKDLKVASNASATVSGRTVTTANCGNAVAIEVRKRQSGDSYGEIRYASNYETFTVPSKVDISSCNVYAVQADGTRIFLAQM